MRLGGTKVTHALESARFRQVSADARRPSVGVADSRIPSTASAIVLALCLGLVSPAALSQSCGPGQVVDELFRHSQLAERLEDREDRGKESCSMERTTLVHAAYDQPFLVPDPLTDPTSDEDFNNRLRNAIGDRALVARPRNPENTHTLYVGCEDEILKFDVAVEMRFHRRDNSADVIQLDVVYREDDGDDEWSPFIDPGSGEIIVLPGTEIDNPRETRQWLASIAGERCAFPAARFTAYAMCEHANTEEEGVASDSSLRMEGGMPVVVGHSLGGAAAQFIATSRPSQESNGWPACPGVHAYAFGSIGLTHSNVGPIRGILKTYASDCDWLVSRYPFSDKVQTGHLFTLPSKSHSIDSIQRDLCGCLRGDENRVLHIHDSSAQPQSNSALCELRNRRG